MMNNYETIQKECKFGMPTADQVLFNRNYTIGYSYFLRQAKWALEIVNPVTVYDSLDLDVERTDTFRKDFRIPVQFRADLVDYKRSGYDRGHLVPSANHQDAEVENSETFLLTNMSPQAGDLNRQKWRLLEQAVRELNAKDNIYETYCLTGPILDLSKPTKFIGKDPDASEDFTEDYQDVDVSIPVPHAYFKSILVETNRGKFYMWSFIMENKKQPEDLAYYRVPTKQVELLAGIKIWPNLQGDWIEWEKSKVRTMW